MEAWRKRLLAGAKLAGLQDEQLESSVSFLMEQVLSASKKLDDWVN